ncbi:MAG TPA: histidinol dehydrogenase [Lacipirellulaceae bacterium]|nr:histidinol dehydrogenase [Lacipirellulaceae bacterium]
MPLAIQRIDTRQPDAQSAINQLRARLAPAGNVVSEAGRQKTLEVFGTPMAPTEVVERICSDVRSQGLEAVLQYTAQLDGVQLSANTLRVPPDELAVAHAHAAPDFLETIRRIRENILRFQTAILPHEVRVDAPQGGQLRQRYVPLERVGICVPGGAAAYPSTVLMTAVPAQAAGVNQIVIVSPPTPNGAYNQDVLATCHALEIREVYRMGGAQAIAALAYGLVGLVNGPLLPVDKIVGPGNLFVALAKKFVFGDVDIDSIAGPSEIVILADETTRPDFAAADLIAQAEHAPGSSVLITWNEPTLNAVAGELEKQLGTIQRGDLARQSLESFGALILVSGRDEAAQLANTLASEHLHITCAEPEDMLGKIRNAGAVFLGPYSPVALGDYVAGPSHVLPTGATARFASGLSSTDFLRSHSVIQYTREGLETVAADAIRMAEREGLTAHGVSVAMRRDVNR